MLVVVGAGTSCTAPADPPAAGPPPLASEATLPVDVDGAAVDEANMRLSGDATLTPMVPRKRLPSVDDDAHALHNDVVEAEVQASALATPPSTQTRAHGDSDAAALLQPGALSTQRAARPTTTSDPLYTGRSPR